MTDKRLDKRLRTSIHVLIGIGLVLVGLAVGILWVLVTGANERALPRQTRMVERIQLGRPYTPSDIPVADSLERLPDITALNRVFRQVADRVTPSVVYIEVEVPFVGDRYHDFDDEEGRFFRRDPSQEAVGSGVLISPQGYVVTNHHVVEHAERVRVTLSDKRAFDARIVGADPSTDIAVLEIEGGEDLPAILFGDSDGLHAGEWVLAVGNPFRLTSTVTAGIVSATGRQVNIIEDDFGIEDFIQTDAAINPGNSGGAVVNLNGELVGISTAIATETGSYEGYGFAVPVNLVARVAGDLIEYGEVQRGYMGVRIQTVDAVLARRLGMDRIRGVYIAGVANNGSAALAGMRGEDVILSVDDRTVNASNELQSMIARRRPGDMLIVQVWRDGEVRELPVELQPRDAPAYTAWFGQFEREPRLPEESPVPEPPSTPGERESIYALGDWGIGLRELTAEEASDFDIEEGVYVAWVEHGSPAGEAGLPRDAAIVQIEGMDIGSPGQALRALSRVSRSGEWVLVKVRRRDGSAAFYEMEVPR